MNRRWRRLRAVPLQAAPRVARQLLWRQWHRLTAPGRPRRATGAELPITHIELGTQPAALLTPPRALAVAAREHLRRRADDALAHRFDLLGSGPVDLGAAINWSRDFKSGHVWPLEHHARLKIVDLEAGFDVKVPWELSRFHHGLALAQAHALSGEGRYAAEFAAQVTAWIAANPPEFGPNWANAMEASIRAANWLAAYDLLKESPALTPDFHRALLTSLRSHGRYIASHLEDGWPGSNHYLADLCGLVWLGARLPGLREAAGWLQAGLAGLERELKQQVYPDGADYEASTGYHYLVTEMTLWAAIAGRGSGVAVPDGLLIRLSAMLDVVAGLIKPDGSLPAFGDLDSGRWLALESDHDRLLSGQDPRGLLALGAALFGRDGWREAAGERGEAVEWLADWRPSLSLHTATLRTADAAPRPSDQGPEVAGAHPQASFPHAGWFVMRRGEHYLAVKAGGNGAGGWGLHAHNDALSFELAVGARSFLVDPGSYVYTGDYRARNEFRSTAMHNTLRLDGAEINRIPETDLFRLENDAGVRVLAWESTAERALLIAEHTGYERLGAIHRREIQFDRQRGSWVVRDRVLPAPGGSGQLHTFEVFFHFAPLPVVADGLRVRTACEAGINLLVSPLDAQGLELSLTEGWVSPRYGVRLPAPVACYTARATLPAEFVFVMWPFDQDTPSDGAVPEWTQTALQRPGAML